MMERSKDTIIIVYIIVSLGAQHTVALMRILQFANFVGIFTYKRKRNQTTKFITYSIVS